jgi:cytochrome c oxidase subunit I+III
VTVSTPHERLEQTWGTWPGLAGWLAAVNHRTIGTRYMVTAFIFFLVAGVEALIMRVQLSVAGLEIIHPDTYNQLFTMHGTTMMFLFLVPFLEGLGIYLVPLMIGARDMVFPRLNAFGYWVYLVSGVMLHWSLLTGTAPDSGWFNYPPLSGIGFNPGPNIDYWVTLITFLEVAALVAAVELIVTVFMQRAPGMSLNRMPLFVWAMLVTAFMIVFAMPPLVVASMMLGLDRFVGTHFFNVAAGGDPLLWQHLFWFFGHPDVYIMLVPALGITAAIVPVFARRPIAGYTLLVVSLVAIGFLSFGLWVHHMYAVGLPIMGMNFFVAASMMIIVPSGVQILAWIVTIWRGALVIRTPFLYAVAFIVLFILGGITGIMVASAPFDWQVHDTFFIVGHFHYVLVGAVVFPVFAAISYWFPKVTGRMLDETVGRAAFWVIFVSFHLTFFPMHILGFQGMPRRVYTYLPGLQWDPLNLVVTIGAFLMAAGVMIFLANLLISARAGEPAGDNPWGADTLEWATTSPPPMYNFRRIPVVRSGNPLWDGRDPQAPMRDPAFAWREAMADAPHGRRQTIATTAMDAVPDHELVLPSPSLWPLWTAMGLSVGFVGVMVHWSLLFVGGVLAVAGLVGWHWPTAGGEPTGAEDEGRTVEGLPALPRGRSPAWGGMAMLVVIEFAALGALLAGYYYLRIRQTEWPPGGIPHPDVLLPAIGSVLLVASGLPMWLAERATRGGAVDRVRTWLPIGLLLAAGYLALKVIEHARLEYSATSHAYGSIVWTISGYSAFHVLAVLVLGSMLWLLHHRGYLRGRRVAAVEAIGVYWYFVALSTVPVFVTLYVAPYFM